MRRYGVKSLATGWFDTTIVSLMKPDRAKNFSVCLKKGLFVYVVTRVKGIMCIYLLIGQDHQMMSGIL